jgi:hypothetical protein
MALSNRTIADSINWAKRLNFNHNPVIGNSLEPALTSANIVLQTILGPPFFWWWNVEELSFNCSLTPPSATSSTANVSATGLLTVTGANNLGVGALLLVGAFTGTLAPLNGSLISVQSVIGTFPNYTGFTAQINSGALTADITAGTFTGTTTQDYVIAPPTGYNMTGGSTVGWFSHIEHSSVYDITNVASPNWMELTVKNNLSLNSSLGRATFISPESEDANGNVTFRVMPSPNKAYPITIHVALTPPTITSINQTWGPLPDYLQCVYDLGFLGWMLAFNDDPRAQMYNSQFKAALLARQDGISQEERDIFLNNWDMLTGRQTMTAQQGMKAREV